MALLTLKSLPYEILQGVCQYLPHCDAVSLSLVDKRCRSVATGVLMQKIHIHITSRMQLQLDIDHWKLVLQCASCIKDVRYLGISGEMPSSAVDKDDLRTGSVADARREQSYSWCGQTAQETIDEDDAWIPLADFLRHLSSVTDVHWSCENQFPPCLLLELHRRHSFCRLHLHTFSFRSLNTPGSQHHEYALACSPCLYSIRPLVGGSPWHNAALLRMVSELAKNLRMVFSAKWQPIDDNFDDVFDWTGDMEMIEDQIERSLIPRWPGFVADTEKGLHARGHLSRLGLETNHSLPLEKWAFWKNATDFSCLQILVLAIPLGITVLNQWTQECPLTSLRELEIGAELRSPRPNAQRDREYREAFTAFLCNLPSLFRLRLTSQPLESGQFASIIRHHGGSLQQLHLLTGRHRLSVVCDADVVEKICQQCSSLEDLTLTVPRSYGDEQEQSVYKMLGSIPKLQSLSLTLNCTNHAMLGNYIHPSLVFSQAMHDELPVTEEILSDYRNTFMNSAIDKTLALAIFRCISARKRQGMLSLECLEIHEKGGALNIPKRGPHGYHDGNEGRILACIAGHWRITRSRRDDSRHELQVEDINDINVKYQALEEAERMTSGADVPQFPSSKVEPAFRALWPASPDGPNDWRQDWHSFPLKDFED